MGVCNNKRDTFQPKRQAPADGGGEPLLEGVFCLCKKTYLMTPNHVMERLSLALLCLLMLGTQDAKCQKFGFKDRTAPDSIGTLRSVCVSTVWALRLVEALVRCFMTWMGRGLSWAMVWTLGWSIGFILKGELAV